MTVSRTGRQRAAVVGRAVLPFGLSLVVVFVLLIIAGASPADAFTGFMTGPFSNAFYFGNFLDSAGLTLICALGFQISWRIGIFNLGGEGQAYAGALVAAEFAVLFPNSPLGVVWGCLCAMLVSGLLGSLSGLLKRALGISELITTFLVSAALVPVIDFAISGPLRDSGGNLLATPEVSPAYRFASWLPPSTLNPDLLVAVLISVLAFFVVSKTRVGYEMRLIGSNAEFASSQRIRVGSYFVFGLGASAALHGLAGAFAVYGTQHAAFTGLTSGLGWNGIAAALIGRTNPFGAILGALVFAWMGAGAKVAMVHTNFSFELSTVVQGVVLLLVTMQAWPKRKRVKS